uniref:NAD-dependent epimerase/dehydratase domain-containing protein n=1 Tax=Leersia perrieri TaxID=77586 RepID=A0A0D9V7C5_9ORYZ
MAAIGDSSAGGGGGTVCVTGGSGFIGSWLVRLLLDRGYTVHATVKNLQDESETKHLQALDGADTRLRLFQMDLLDPASVTLAVDGAHGVIHVASPVILNPTQDPEATTRFLHNLIRFNQSCGHDRLMLLLLLHACRPAVSGALNVLRAAKDCGIARVVMVSSQTAMVPIPGEWPAGKVIDDDCWADVELLKKKQFWYNVSKILAEKAAWDFAAKEGLQLVVLHPGLVLGPMLTPSPTASLGLLLQILGGQKFDIEDFFVGCVDVRDVARSLIVLYENTTAQGRHLCIESIERLADFHDKLAELYPEFPVYRIQEDKQDWVVRSKTASKKLIDLGVQFIPLDKTIRDTVDCLRSKVPCPEREGPSRAFRAKCGKRSSKKMAAIGDSSAGGGAGTVCVTGGSGFIGSWLVRLLLDRGYTVHATVKNLQDEGETKHLEALDGANTRLRLFQMDLLDPASVTPAVDGAHGGELLQPAVSGALNVLRVAKDCGVARVVMVSSQTAMVPIPEWPAGKVIDDDCWADVELLKKKQFWYNVSKTLAEKAAWDFASKEGLQLVVLNPGLVLGPMLTPSPTASLGLLLQILGGQKFDIEDFYVGCVDVRDVAQSLIVLYENTSAQGRHLCIESIERLIDFHDKLAELNPEFPIFRIQEDKQGWVVRSKAASKKLIDLGVQFIPFDKTIRDTVDCLRSKGYI